MKNNLTKKYSVLFVGMIYILAYFLQSISFLDFGLILNKTYAESQLNYTNIVAIFVDDKIYHDNIEDDIQRYAQEYIQGENNDTRHNAISNSKAIVLPIDTDNIDAVDITKILENMYFDGISGEPSKLIGTVLIGDIALPVVNQDGFIFPTVYPYVDFEEQKFIWDDKTKYFVYNDNPDGQAEIRHGIINFDEDIEYENYFEKLREYSNEPSEFIGKNIWYDDLIANKQFFYEEALDSYINNFLFAEDLGYHRYTDLMVKLMQETHNEMIAELLSGFDGMEELQAASASMNTPTMTLETMIKDGYLKSYTSLIGGKQLDNIVNNVETSNRRVEQYTGSNGELKSRTALDTHYLKMEQKDETLLRINGGLEPLIITFNNALEDILNDKIEEEQYWMNEVIPLSYLEYDGDKKINILKPWKYKYVWKTYDAFENYFFGINAKNLNNMQETSTYRGTFRNFDDIYGLTIEDLQSGDYPTSDIIDDIDLNKKSVGGSYDIFATQIDANRGYNITNTVNELNIYGDKKIAQRDYWNTKCDKKFLGICWVKRRRESDQSPADHLCNPGNTEEEGGCEMPADFAMRNWGGASPLNLSGMDDWTIAYNFQDAVMPIFDIAGSKQIEDEEAAANSFEGVQEYSRLVQKTFVPHERKYWTKNADRNEPDLYKEGYNTAMGEDMNFTNWMPVGDLDNPTWVYTEPKRANSVEFFDKFDNSAHWEGNIVKITKEYDNDYIGRGEIFTYRTLDSRVKNNASTSIDVNGGSYKIFEDPQSPSKIMYDGILNTIARIDDSVQANIDSLNGTANDSINQNLDILGENIDILDDKFDDLLGYDNTLLAGLSVTEKQNLANEWNDAYTQQDGEDLKTEIEEIKDQLVDIDGFVGIFSYDYLAEYIDQQEYAFDINRWNLIVLDTWKTNMLREISNTKNSFLSIDGYIDTNKNKYNNIVRLEDDIINLLSDKKNNINELVDDGYGNSIGCEIEYENICEAIDNVIANINLYNINDGLNEIANFEFDDEDDNGSPIVVRIKPFESIPDKIGSSNIGNQSTTISDRIRAFEVSDDPDMTQETKGMNLTTSDRAIDSPKYITFKGVGGDKVKLIYPNIYKSEIFKGDINGSNNILDLKSPDEINNAIEEYLTETVKKYNEYLRIQQNKKSIFYNQNDDAFDLLEGKDLLATPNRNYDLMDEDFLINELESRLENGVFFSGQMGGYEPIEFIAHMMYYQNIAREKRQLGDTILDDMDNSRSDFDINEKIVHIVDNYLIRDNNKGNFITPGYRDNGYEVAFINSDGADYIGYKSEPAFIKRVKSAAKDYKEEDIINIEQTQLEEEVQNECNIPADGSVLLFNLEEGGSPRLKAVRCWWEKVRDKPFEFEFDRASSQGPVFNVGYEGDTIGEIIGNNLGLDEIQSQYMNQLDLMDMNDENDEVLNNIENDDNSNPGDYQKLEQIISYAKIQTDNQNINADTASGYINISAGVELGDVEFYVQNIGSSKISISNDDETISDNITQGFEDYSTGMFVLDPFDNMILDFNIDLPVDGINVLVFHMCLPGAQDVNNCVKKSLRLNIIPGGITEIKIEKPGNKILEGSKMPIIVKGLDGYGNNVGQLLLERFDISVSTGSLSYKSAIDSVITFSDFDKSKFILNADDGIVSGTEIMINVDGMIGDEEGTHASTIISVIKGELDIYEDDILLDEDSKINVVLPSTNDYAYKDSFNITQSNLETIPTLVLKLVDEDGDAINIESIVKITSSNGLVNPGNIESRSITKSIDGMTFDVEQNRFKKDTMHIISSGEVTVYLMPNFKAGEDILKISMPGIDDMEIPIVVSPAPASMIQINSKKSEISTYSHTSANLIVMDNWKNPIVQDTMIKLGAIGPIGISGFDTSSTVINIEDGILDFEINSDEDGGVGFVYAIIEGLGLDEQKPGYSEITVQKRILPENDLNIMYLNLFGSDWGNQRGYLSENNKYIQNLINNSDKLLAATTQLVMAEKIKKYSVITDDSLQISNIEGEEINLSVTLDEGNNGDGNEGNGKINFEIKNIGVIGVDAASFDIKEVDVSDENTEIVISALVDNYSDDNILIYIPEDTDSIIESNEVIDNAIYINGENIFDIDNIIFDNSLSVILTDKSLANYQVRDMSMGDKKIGRMLISVQDTQEINMDIWANNEKYDYNNVWMNGSTDHQGLGLYEIDSILPDNTIGYESIQDSIDSTLGIGFVGNFKNITNFGAGESVGESTLPFSSEFLINIGDPLLKRINENESTKIYDEDGTLDTDTGFDKGLGEVIYSEPGKTIFKVINIDFNNDDLEDIIVSFTDGTIKILKNYGGNNGNSAYEQLGDLMVLADGIEDIIIGDVDGNDYEDIIIWTRGDLLRVYKNDEGVFDVDGYPICLNTNVKNGMVSEDPQNIDGIFQIFFEDMDQDGKLDIITNDKLGYIKIFYGGKNNNANQDNYVSTDKYKCDDQRFERLSYGEDTDNGSNTKIAYRFGIRVNENIKVLDQSLLHREGINPDDDINISAEDLGINLDMFDGDLDENNIDNLLSEAMNFDTDDAIQAYRGSERYKEANFGKIPVYEDVERESELEYVEMGCLTGEDPSKIYKQYEDINGGVLENGDKVQINITIEAHDDFVGTFIDNIKGPWIIPLTGDNDMIESFWFDSEDISQETIDDQLVFHWDMINSRYMIDNLHIDAEDEIKIHYWVYYDGDVQTNKIEIKDINGEDYERGANGITGDILDEYPQDDYPDIKVKPSDGCNKSMFVLFNEDQDRDYAPEYVDLTELLIDYSNANQNSYDNTMSEISNTLADNATSNEDPNFDNIPGLDSMLESWGDMDILGDTFDIDNIISQGGINLSDITNAPMQIIDGLLGDVMDQVDDIMGGMCDGFDLSEYGVGGSSNCGLPVPFNQGFLGPGNYHLFGCFDIPPLTETLGKGWPVLNIPGNWPGPSGYMPIPGFFGFPFRGPTDGFLGGPKSGPYPSQFRLYLVPTLTAEIGIAMCFGPYSVGTAIPDPFSSIGGNCIVTSIPLPCKNAGISNPNATNKIPEAYLDLETCSNQNVPCFVGEGESTSSLEIVSSSNNSNNMTSAVPDGSFAGGFINIEKVPITTHGYDTPESGIEINGIKLIGGADAKNTIRGGAAQGLIKKVSKMRMDKQINYITSNLTNFKVDVYWPDFAEVMGGMGQGELKSALTEAKKQDCLDEKGTWDSKEATCTVSDEQKCKNRGMERQARTNTCDKKLSPNQNDEALSKLDSRSQNNLLDREQITSISDTSFANPFEKLEAMFEEVPLINIRTENITVKVPMISSEDITSYIHMSKTWITKQEKVLEEWKDFLNAMIGVCGGRTDISSIQDLKDAYYELKDQLKDELAANVNSIENQIDKKTAEIENLVNPDEKKKAEAELKELNDSSSNATLSASKKITAINDLNNKYNLNFLGKYSIFESCDGKRFFIRKDANRSVDSILSDDVYLSYIPGAEKELTMYTSGYTLLEGNQGGSNKIVISYERNNEQINNGDVCLKKFSQGDKNQCIELFVGGKFEAILDDFLNIQTSSDQLIMSVKQNIETLELYKKFPLDLYEWIHVGDRYMSEISSIINNFLGTLSLWMKTNATRYSQYVDSLILIMTTIQTYQAIIDLSVNWSDRCSSCTNDNYDQFACKLGLLCPDNIPILEVPPMKIPSIYIDLSHMNLATDIKLPKFDFVPTTVPLPRLPNIPSPPNIDMSLNVDGVSAGANIVESLLVQLEQLDLSLTLPSIPVIPSPPNLPEIPSFIPSVKMELPILPPAPKIPELPEEVQIAIDTAEVIGRILCIVKGNIGLVGEDSIKAKVEQMSQRTYEVPYWDNLDQTLAERKEKAKGKVGDLVPDWISDTFEFLKSEEFAEAELKGFDIGIDSYVNLQYNFAGFYTFIDQVVGEVNKVSSMPAALMQEGVDRADGQSKELEKRMTACATNPISEECLKDLYTGEIKETKENLENLKKEIALMSDRIENGFGGVKEAMQLIASKENKVNKTPEDIQEIELLYETYGDTIQAYKDYMETYASLTMEYNEIKQWMSDKMDELMGAVNEQISNADDWVDSAANFEKMKERNAKIQSQMDEFDIKQTIRREQRGSNLDSLYKEISYVDYNQDTYEKNMKMLKNSLGEIQSKSNDESFKKEIASYIKLANTDNNISAANDSIGLVMEQYRNIVADHKNNNEKLIETIGKDYDKFLYAVAQNDVRLVGSDDINISLSSNLFEINDDSLEILKQQENINKTYLDYESKNIDGYINAMENNNPEKLNMSDRQYTDNKEYLYGLKEKTQTAYSLLDNNLNQKSDNKLNKTKLITQSNGETNPAGSNNAAYTDISSYIDGKVIKTIEGSFDLANDEYVSNFQGRSLMVDINNDDANDLILWDQNNIYIKYRNGNSEYENIDYKDDYYKYEISSYQELIDDSEEGFIKINDIYIKLCDENREVKNFEYNGGNFDSIKVNWMNSKSLGDDPKGYLVKMIHRVDLFNDKELIVDGGNNELFDKKYVLVLPKGAAFTGTKISLEEGTYRTEDILSGLIFDVMYYNEDQDTIDLTIKDIPRNWQYSEIYTLNLYEDVLYFINNASSNQIVAGPQIIADSKGPIPTVTLYRPMIDTVINTGERADIYVSTNYILQANWEDNVSVDRLWIADENGNILVVEENINLKTGYIELDGLFFTGASAMNYYFGATDTNNNSEVVQVNLNVNIPKINIVDVKEYGNDNDSSSDDLSEGNIKTPVTITAEIDNGIDEGYVQFSRFRNDLRQSLTGAMGGIERDKYSLEPNQTIITGGFYDFGNDIGLYLQDGELAAKIDPDNGNIYILDGFEDRVNIELGYATNRPIVTIREIYGNVLFSIILPSEELIDVVSDTLEIQDLQGDIFGDFDGGKAIIKNNEVWIYVGPQGQIYTELNVYGDYSFDNETQTVKYSFRDSLNGNDEGYIEIKIANLLGK